MTSGRMFRTVFTIALVVMAGEARALAADTITMESAVRTALDRNPELKSLASEVRAAEARLRGASLLVQNNPEVGVSAGQRSRRTETWSQVEAEVAQRLEIFGQRGARIDSARSALRAGTARLKARRAEIAATVRQMFARALASEAQLGLAREALDLARQANAAATRRFDLGDGTRMEVNTARVEVGRAARELSLAQRRRVGSFADLRLLLGLEPSVQLQVQGSLDSTDMRPPASVAGLLEEALSKRADLQAAREDLAESQAESRLSGREWLPSPRLGARYEREEAANVVLGTLSFDFPLWNRNQAARGVTAARVEQATVALEAVERRARQEVELAVSRLELAREAARAFEGEVVSALEQNLKLITNAYQAGKLGLFELLVIRRDTLDARRGYIDARQELIEARAELARAIGHEETDQ